MKIKLLLFQINNFKEDRLRMFKGNKNKRKWKRQQLNYKVILIVNLGAAKLYLDKKVPKPQEVERANSK